MVTYGEMVGPCNNFVQDAGAKILRTASCRKLYRNMWSLNLMVTMKSNLLEGLVFTAFPAQD